MKRCVASLVFLVCLLATRGEDKEPPLKLPEGWKADDPVPLTKSNCVRCHLTAGRELTQAVRDFTRSVHDLAGYSCNDCHGGNTKNDASAHEEQFDFIGTKLSAHVAGCSSCHLNEAETHRKGKHYHDLSKGVNTKLPVCIDCHGNHDIGNPPEAFALMNVCTDCHKDFAAKFPHASAVVEENDLLWKTIRQVRARSKKAADPIPAQFHRELGSVRHTTARLMHSTSAINQDEAKGLNEKAKRLRERLENWLKQK